MEVRRGRGGRSHGGQEGEGREKRWFHGVRREERWLHEARGEGREERWLHGVRREERWLHEARGERREERWLHEVRRGRGRRRDGSMRLRGEGRETRGSRGGGEGGEMASWGQEGEGREERWLRGEGSNKGEYNLTEACLVLRCSISLSLYSSYLMPTPLFICNQHFSYLGDKQYLYGDMVIILGFSFVSKSHVLCKVYCSHK